MKIRHYEQVPLKTDDWLSVALVFICGLGTAWVAFDAFFWS